MLGFSAWLRCLKWRVRYLLRLRGAPKDYRQRLVTHAEHLDEYCSRWLGYCQLPYTSADELFDSGLFVVLDAASRVANRDLMRVAGSVPASVHREWVNYWNYLLQVKQNSSKSKAHAEELNEKLLAFVREVRLSALR